MLSEQGEPGADRPLYAAAAGVAGLVLLGYLLTLAPTVTFWDAGELIAAAKTLGIPHPPGTPLFVMIAHVWALLFPIGEYAFRTNLLSALLSAAGAGFFFLVAHESIRALTSNLEGETARILRLGGATASAMLGAFTFTNWQNSNETEVYAVATFTIAAMSWLALVWRRYRGTDRAPRVLLLIVYLAGISIGNHLLALLAGPAIVMFMATTLRQAPAADPVERATEWGQVAVIAGVWALLIGLGLGSTRLIQLGGFCFAAAATYAFLIRFMATRLQNASVRGSAQRRKEWGQATVVVAIWALLISFALGARIPIQVVILCFLVGGAVFARMGQADSFAALTLFIASIGITPYLYLYLRSAQHPPINEAAPATFHALLAVIRRAQYPPRTPLDDPTVAHGPENPGRTLALFGIQMADYVVYFTWQWAKSLASVVAQVGVTLVYVTLGIRGSLAQRRADRSAWWLLAALFLVTGPGLVIYMNFRPGFGRWFDSYPVAAAHEVRERDYFFVVSFIVWGIWAGMGLVVLARAWMRRPGTVRRLAPAALLLALLPVAFNWTAASRRHGPDARLAADWAYDLLNTAAPYGILFTYGDNDTFPLWWAQEVAGIRQDVVVVCLALANTDWYMRQLRDAPVRPVDRKNLPPIWQGAIRPPPDWPLHGMTDSMIATAMSGYAVPEDQRISLGPLSRTLKAGSFLLPNDILTLSVVQQNVGRRPIVWAITTGRGFGGLEDYVVQQALGFALRTSPPDTTSPAIDNRKLAGAPLDIPTTERLLWETYRYAGLLEGDVTKLESTSASIASTLSLPYTQLSYVYSARGQNDKLMRTLERAMQLTPNPALRAALAELRIRGAESLKE